MRIFRERFSLRTRIESVRRRKRTFSRAIAEIVRGEIPPMCFTTGGTHLSTTKVISLSSSYSYVHRYEVMAQNRSHQYAKCHQRCKAKTAVLKKTKREIPYCDDVPLIPKLTVNLSLSISLLLSVCTTISYRLITNTVATKCKCR